MDLWKDITQKISVVIDELEKFNESTENKAKKIKKYKILDFATKLAINSIPLVGPTIREWYDGVEGKESSIEELTNIIKGLKSLNQEKFLSLSIDIMNNGDKIINNQITLSNQITNVIKEEHVKTLDKINKNQELIIDETSKIFHSVEEIKELLLGITHKVNDKETDLDFVSKYIDDLLSPSSKFSIVDPLIDESIEARAIWFKDGVNLDHLENFRNYEDGENWNIDKFLRDSSWRETLVSNFGMGKSTFFKYIAERYARQIKADLTKKIGLREPIPIFVKIHDDSKSIHDIFPYFKENTISLLKRLSTNKDTKILLIIDGGEKYVRKNLMKGLISELTKIHPDYPQLKVLINTRPEKNLLEHGLINEDDSYVGLRLYNDDEIIQFLDASSQITVSGKAAYAKLVQYGFKNEAKEPLFCQMLSIIFTKMSQKTILTDDDNYLLRRSWLYLNFISVIQTKYNLDSEKRHLLRCIVMLNRLYPSLTESELVETLEDKLKIHSSIHEIQELSKYFLQHESTWDYLLAEHYLENIVQNNHERLNLGIPNKDTIEFLDGLIGLLYDYNKEVKHEDYESIVEILLDKRDNKIVETLTHCAVNSINNNNLISFDPEINPNSIPFVIHNDLWLDIPLNSNNLGNFWIHKWISLFVLSKSNQFFNIINYKKLKQNISFIIKNSSSYIPNYLKNLSNLDLEDTDISHSDLSGANLTNTNLSGSDLSYSDLSGANLTNTNLSGSDLTSAKLSEIKINNKKGPIFEYSHMFHTDLDNANLQNANLSGAFLWQTDLAGTNLENANLDYGVLQYVRMTKDTDLTCVDLTNIAGLQSPLNNAKGTEYRENDVDIYNTRMLRSEKNNQFSKYHVLVDDLLTINGVRFAGIADQSRRFSYSQRSDKDVFTKLTDKDVLIISHYAWLNGKRREYFDFYFGFTRYSMIEYDTLKIIVISLNKSEIMIITTTVETNHDLVIQKVYDYKEKINEEFEPINKNIENNDVDSITDEISNSEIKNHFLPMYKKINSNEDYVIYANYYSKESKSLYPFTPNHNLKSDNISEWHKNSLIKDVWRRWRYRLQLENKLGNHKYVLLQYENIFTITSIMEFKNEKYLLFVIATADAPKEKLIQDILSESTKLKEKLL